MRTFATQRSPVAGLRPMPFTRSVPGWLSIRFSTENDPLGAFVRAEPLKATLPLSLIRTFQRAPFLF